MNQPLAKRWLPVAAFFGGSFLLNLLWENLQAPLYVGYTSFAQHFWICFKATGCGSLYSVKILVYTGKISPRGVY